MEAPVVCASHPESRGVSLCLSCPTHPSVCILCSESKIHKGHVLFSFSHLALLMRQHLLRSASMASTRLRALPAFEIDVAVLDPAAAATTAADVSSAEPLAVIELREMASRIAHEIELVAGNATSAHNRVDDLKGRAEASAAAEDAHHAIHEACSEITSQIDEVEARKVSELEANAVHIDELLLLAMAELPAVCDMARSLRDEQVIGQFSELQARLASVHARCSAIPRCPSTEATIFLYAPAELSVGGALPALRAAKVITATVPAALVRRLQDPSRRVRPGTSIVFRLTMDLEATALEPWFDTSAFLAALAARVDVRATLLEFRGALVGATSASTAAAGVAARQPPPLQWDAASGRGGELDLQAVISINEPQACVEVTFVVPAHVPLGSRVVVHSIAVAGENVAGAADDRGGFPATFNVVASTGVRPELVVADVLKSHNQAPVISDAGFLWIPCGAEVRCFADDGAVAAVIPTAPLGLPGGVLNVALDEKTGTAFISSQSSGVSVPLVAFDVVTHKKKWQSAENVENSYGLVVLTEQGIVVVGSHRANRISAHRISDGSTVATADVVGLTYMTADAKSGTVFVATFSGSAMVFRWHHDAFVQKPPLNLKAHLMDSSHNPMCVMPPASPDDAAAGKGYQLVVCVQDTSNVAVWSLPELQFVKKFRLPGIDVAGVAADPSGCVIVFMDCRSKGAVARPWPLPASYVV